MNTHTQIIYMQSYAKKILLFISIILVLFTFLLLGKNYFEKQLASLSGIITAWVTINPLEVEVSAPSEVEIDKVFKVEARVINKGKEKVENAKGEIFLQEGLVLLKKDPVQEIGVIPGGKEKKISWSVKGEKIGSYIITVKVSGELRGDTVSAEDSTIVRVIAKAPLGRGRSFDLFQRFFDFFRERLGY